MRVLRYFIASFFILFLTIAVSSQTIDYQSATQESLSVKIKENLEIIKPMPKTDTISEQTTALKNIVLAATERAKRICAWDPNRIKQETVKLFDETMVAIKEYLDLVDDTGPVYKAAYRIRESADEAARKFEETKKQTGDIRYDALITRMKGYSTKISELLAEITRQRINTINEVNKLKKDREFYLACMEVDEYEVAIKELEGVIQDLKAMSDQMISIQKTALSI
jgi:hypothetical protein